MKSVYRNWNCLRHSAIADTNAEVFSKKIVSISKKNAEAIAACYSKLFNGSCWHKCRDVFKKDCLHQQKQKCWGNCRVLIAVYYSKLFKTFQYSWFHFMPYSIIASTCNIGWKKNSFGNLLDWKKQTNELFLLTLS